MLKILLVILITINLYSKDWTEKLNKNGIIIETRENSRSDIDEFRAIAIINSDIKKILDNGNNYYKL